MCAYLVCPASLLTGATSAGSSASVKRVKSLGTSHMKIFPSSEPEAITRSLKGCLQAMPSAQRERARAWQTSADPSGRRSVFALPVGVQNNSGVPAEEGHLVGQLTLLVHGNDRECAAAARLPIDREVLRIGLDQIRIPSIPTDVEVVVAELLPGRLPKDVPCDASKWRFRQPACPTAKLRRGGMREHRRSRPAAAKPLEAPRSGPRWTGRFASFRFEHGSVVVVLGSGQR